MTGCPSGVLEGVGEGSLLLSAVQMCRERAGMRMGIPKPAKSWEQGGKGCFNHSDLSGLGSEQLVGFTLLYFQSRRGRGGPELRAGIARRRESEPAAPLQMRSGAGAGRSSPGCGDTGLCCWGSPDPGRGGGPWAGTEPGQGCPRSLPASSDCSSPSRSSGTSQSRNCRCRVAKQHHDPAAASRALSCFPASPCPGTAPSWPSWLLSPRKTPGRELLWGWDGLWGLGTGRSAGAAGGVGAGAEPGMATT